MHQQEVDEGGKPHTYVMVEYIGIDLKQAEANNGAMAPKGDAREKCAEAVMKQLTRLHAHGITSRDIKPQNVLYDDVTESCTIIDYGAGIMVGSDGTVTSAGLNFTETYSPYPGAKAKVTGSDRDQGLNARESAFMKAPESRRKVSPGTPLGKLGVALVDTGVFKKVVLAKGQAPVIDDSMFLDDRMDIYQSGYVMAYMLGKDDKSRNEISTLLAELKAATNPLGKHSKRMLLGTKLRSLAPGKDLLVDKIITLLSVALDENFERGDHYHITRMCLHLNCACRYNSNVEINWSQVKCDKVPVGSPEEAERLVEAELMRARAPVSSVSSSPALRKSVPLDQSSREHREDESHTERRPVILSSPKSTSPVQQRLKIRTQSFNSVPPTHVKKAPPNSTTMRTKPSFSKSSSKNSLRH